MGYYGKWRKMAKSVGKSRKIMKNHEKITKI